MLNKTNKQTKAVVQKKYPWVLIMENYRYCIH